MSSRMRQRLRDERGFTLVEIVVAAGLMSIGLLSLVSVLDSSRDLVSLSERRETALHRAQLAIERVQALDYAFIALPDAPTPSSDANDPRVHVQSGPPRYRWDHLSSGAPYDPLVIDSVVCAGTPTPCLEREKAFQDGRLSGSIHTFVTWVDDNGDGTNDMKRVTVAVTIDQGPPRPPVALSTIVRKTL